MFDAKSETQYRQTMVAIILAMSVGSFIIGFLYGEGYTKRSAITAGAAHWEIDAQSGNISFVWGNKILEKN